MRGNTNFSGVQEQGKYELPPEGIYGFEILEKTDKTSKNGDPMVNIKLVITSGEQKDKYVYDNILIPLANSPAAQILGRTKHFLHCIGEPFEGENVEWDSDRWVWKNVRAAIKHEPANEYHKFPKAVITEYILDEEIVNNQEEGPNL